METKIPHTKQEAFAQLDAMLSEKEKNELVKSDSIEYHFSLGMWIRNNWIYEQEVEDVKRLAKAFRTEWLTQAQMAELFEKDQSVVARHINNAFKEGELEKESNMQFLHNTQYKYRPTM